MRETIAILLFLSPWLGLVWGIVRSPEYRAAHSRL